MADVAKGESKSGSQEKGSGAVQPRGERAIGRGGIPSLFSLTPREFFSASPFELMRRFTDEMDRFFEGTLPSGRGLSSLTVWSPPIEVSEQDGHLSVCAELPGLKKEDVKVEVTPEGITISGQRKREEEERQGHIYRSERYYGAFRRTIPLPDDAQVDQAKATFENGLLTVTIPVPASAQRRREIPIEGGDSGQQSAKQAKAA